ncbi:MAG: potassium transporter Trk [Kiritimatiellaeota bacterium]|nr:potassium transporter Trk [Kiritimatiellota bacterium]
MQRETDIVWRTFLLGVCGLFHALLLQRGQQVLIAAGVEPGLLFSAWTWVSAFGLLAVAAICMSLWETSGAAPLLGAAAAFTPLPFYLLLMPHDSAPAVFGILACLAFGRILARPEDKDGDEGEWGRDGVRPSGWSHVFQCAEWLDALLLGSVSCGFAGLFVYGYGWGTFPPLIWTEVGLVAVVVAGSLAWEVGAWHGRSVRYRLWPMFLLAAAGFCAVRTPWRAGVVPILALRQLVVAWEIWREVRGGRAFWRHLTERPAQLLVGSFAAAILLGTLLLSLPAATADGRGLAQVDALFTGTSATCVTGLIVVDTGKDLSVFGQLVILGLIQAGGLGIMTISTFIALVLGRSIGLREEFAFKEAIGEQRTGRARRLVVFIVLSTACIEAVGAAVLAPGFRSAGYGWPRSVYLAVFHSISAFCNAGFSLFSDSLCGFVDRPGMVLVVSMLIIVGGLGFGVLYSLVRGIGRGRRPGLHVQIVLATSLLVGGGLLIYLFETGHAAAGGGRAHTLLNAWFQSVTARTAGFNTVPISGLRQGTLVLLMLLMFIGGAPGSTAGGIKLTTFAVLVLAIRSVVVGRESVVVGGRRITPRTVIHAAVLAFLAAGVIAAVGLVLMLSQDKPALPLLFEAVSAFGTVGLSMGVTPDLTSLGKLCIVLLMFVGRVGPLTLLVMMRPRRASAVDYPEAEVAIG